MALVQGVHILAHGDKAEARRIALDIQQHQRLLVGTNTLYGAGVYAWYRKCLHIKLQDYPQVLFEICDNSIVDICKRDGTPLGFFRIPGIIGNYISVRVISFSNLCGP